MRVLVSIRPFFGHFHPTVPLARSLGAAGHEVRFATEKSFCPVVERAGFFAQSAGLDPFAPIPWEGYEFSEAVTRQKVDDILDVASSWPLDLIVRDPTDFAAVVAAEALNLPHVTLGLARYIPTLWWRQLLGSSLDAIRRTLGIATDPEFTRLHPWLYIDTVPPWLQCTHELPAHVVRSIRPEPYETPPEHPVALKDLPDKPIVLVTLGTVYNQRPELLERLCRGAVRAGAQVICTLGPRQNARAFSIINAAGIRVEQYVPLSDVLPHCTALLNHGGYNTVLASLLHGVPLMIVPLGSDNFHNARRCVELGVGVSEDPDTVSEDRIVQIVSDLLTRPEYREAATRLAKRTAQLAPPSAAVPWLEQLARVGPLGKIN
jgi:UDP:flavonoid glycosyltransferase YjiC (YdhE family)